MGLTLDWIAIQPTLADCYTLSALIYFEYSITVASSTALPL